MGVKYLKSPLDPVTGEEVGLTLFSNTINGGAFDDAANVTQLYRYLSNNISVAAGDAACNTGDPRATKICYINNGQEDDMRFFQASGPLNLAPGGFGSIVVAYIFAAPRIVGACVGPGTCDLKPGDPTRLSDAARLLSEGANAVDSVSGYVDFRGAGCRRQRGRRTRSRCCPARCWARRWWHRRCSATSSCCRSRPSRPTSS